jgi:two-component system chemotaxis response regulator CheB
MRCLMPANTSRRLMLADPDSARRRHILALLQGITAIEAGSMSEAFDLAESTRPHAVALAAELSGDPGLGMFLHLMNARSVAFVIYGEPSSDRTPTKFRNYVSFIDVNDHRDEMKLVQTLSALVSTGGRVSVSGSDTAAAGRSHKQPNLIVIGASTGGVSALETVLTTFPADCPPTLVVQHIRPGFIDGMIRRLNQRCSPEVLAAGDAMRPGRGQICVAADTERHLVVQSGDPLRCRLKATEPRHGHRPSVDALFESAAGRTGVAAALLTGMGADGAEGMARIKDLGGLTIAQNEATCVVYGMPRVAVEMGAAHLVLPLEQIASALLGHVRPRAPARSAESAR